MNNKLIKRLSWTLIIFTFIIVLTCLLLNTHKQNETTIVKIGYLPSSASVPLFVAIEQGYFDNEGLNVELFKMQSSNQLIDGLISNRVDAIISVASQPLLSAESSASGSFVLFTVSSLNKTSMFESLIVKKESGIAGLQDLKGKRIGVFPGSTAKTFLNLYLENNGVNTSNIQYIPLTPSNQIGALNSGSIDAIFAYEPTKTIALNNGNIMILSDSVFAELQDPFYIGVSAFSSKFANNNLNTANNVKKVIEKSIDFMRENEKEARLILPKYTSLSEELALNSPYIPGILKIKEVDENKFQEFSDLLLDLELIQTQVNIENLLWE